MSEDRTRKIIDFLLDLLEEDGCECELGGCEQAWPAEHMQDVLKRAILNGDEEPRRTMHEDCLAVMCNPLELQSRINALEKALEDALKRIHDLEEWNKPGARIVPGILYPSITGTTADLKGVSIQSWYESLDGLPGEHS